MRLSWLILLVILMPTLLVASLAADAEQPAKVHRVGYISGGSARAGVRVVDAFRQGLRDLGYVEGKNIVLEYRWADGRFERLPDLAAELVRLKVDVILAAAQPAIVAAKNATQTIPIVASVALVPVEAGLVSSLAQPGGNITGVSLTVGPEIAGKWLGLLKESVPKVSRVAVLLNPATPARDPFLREIKVAARSLRVKLQILEVRGPEEFERAFLAMASADALVVFGDSLMFLHRTRLADLVARSGLPAMWTLREYVEAGGLMAYGASLPDVYRRAATYVDKVLKGAKPADLPMEQPTTFELVINLKTANALGLTIPQSVLVQANEVIK